VKRIFIYSFALLLILTCFGCALQSRPQVLAFSDLAPFRPQAPEQITNYRDAVATVVSVSKQLGLPTVDPLYLKLYRNDEQFVEGLINARVEPALAQDTAKFAWGMGQPQNILINAGKLEGYPKKSVLRFIAHEYAHLLEYAVSGNQPSPAQWIREGFAEWLAAKVIDALGWGSYDSELKRAETSVHRLAFLPKISDLVTLNQWVKSRNTPQGSILTYRLAFVLADRLIQKRGPLALIDYFRTHDFKSSFGVSWEELEAQLPAAPAVGSGEGP